MNKYVIAIAICCAVIAVVLANKPCHDGTQCTCGHDETAHCNNHICSCTSTGSGKRANEHCTTDANCTSHVCHHGNPTCVDHGDHQKCGCTHP